MPKDFISIQDAAELSKKSIQTIRRAIKSKKLKCKKSKTPQGFNYLIGYSSLCEIYGIRESVQEKASPKMKTKSHETKEHFASSEEVVKKSETGIAVQADDFKALTSLLEQMVNQHSEERRNFMKLVNTLQEKIFVLENQVNLLQVPGKKWYQVWR